MKSQKIWIDVTNSPHVLFFEPIIRELEKRGYEVRLTAREYAQVLPLLNRFGLKAKIIGRHQGKNFLRKAAGMLYRSFRLILFGAGKGFSLAVSHSSNDLAVAAYILRIPQVVMFDYEYAELSHKVNLKLANKALMPDVIPRESLLPYGIGTERIDTYSGLKEQVYLPYAVLDDSILKDLGLKVENIIVTMRTPATMSAYHRFENELFDSIVDELSTNEQVQLVLLPRSAGQKAKYAYLKERGVVIPEKTVDGPSLIAVSDLVIGAGGTINREAVALGIPAYTLFKGKMGAIDKKLIEEGYLIDINNISDIKLEKRGKAYLKPDSNLQEVVDKILATISS